MSEPGSEVMARFVGAENVERGREYLEQLDPELHRYIIDFVYGEVYAGEVLDPKTRALCTVAMHRRRDRRAAGSRCRASSDRNGPSVMLIERPRQHARRPPEHACRPGLSASLRGLPRKFLEIFGETISSAAPAEPAGANAGGLRTGPLSKSRLSSAPRGSECGERPARVAVTTRCSFGATGERMVASGPEKRQCRHG